MSIINYIKCKVADIFKVLLCAYSICLASAFTGTVKDSKSGEPVKNARVSLGYTDFVTHTDENGKFTLSDETAVRRDIRMSASEKFSMHCRNGSAVIDFSDAPSVTQISIYSLNGKRIYNRNIVAARPQLRIGDFTHGIYLLRLETSGKSTFTFRINTSAENRFAGRVYGDPVQFMQAEVSPAVNEPLIIQHDSYYPSRIQISQGKTDFTVEMKDDPRAAIFDETKVYTYNFTITTDDSLKMEHDAVLENYVPAQFTFNDSLIGQVGIRYKGSSYSLPNCFDSAGIRSDKDVCQKISLKLKFNKYLSDQKFYSMKLLNLHSMSADETKMHDILSYRLFREMGIYAPRTAYVKVNINGVFQGLFIAVEAPDGRFTKSRWPEDPDGNLYKEKWPIKENADYYRNGLETNEDSGNVSKMVDFYKAIQASDKANFAANVSKYIDFNYFLRYIAVDRAIHNADGMMTWYVTPNWTGNHNYYFYEETASDGKFWIIPWDLHVTFSETDPIVDDAGVPEWNVAPDDCEPVPIWGTSIGFPAHCDPLTGMTADLFWNEYVKICENMLKNEFSVNHLTEKIDFCKQLIDTIITRDPYIFKGHWKGSAAAIRKTVSKLNETFDEYIHKERAVSDTIDIMRPSENIESVQK